jgi:hypothetical protein
MADGDRELVIPLKIDRSGAKKELAAHEGEARQSIDRTTQHETQAFEQRLANAKKVDEKRKADAKKTAEEIKGIEDQYILKDYESRVQKEERLAAKKKADATRHAETVRGIEDQYILKDYHARVGAEQKKQELQARTILQQQEGIAAGIKGVAQFGAGMVGLAGASSVVGIIADQFVRVRDTAIESTKMVRDYRDMVKQLAEMKGTPGGTGAESAAQLQFRKLTLQTAPEAIEFQTRSQPGLDTAVQTGLMKPEEAQVFQALSGSYQAKEGGAAGAQGALVGGIPSWYGKAMTGQEAFAKEQNLKNIFKSGKYTWGEGAGQFSQLSGEMGAGGTYEPQKLAALHAMFSQASEKGETATTLTKEFTTATLGGIDRKRGAGVEGGMEAAQAQGKYLRGLMSPSGGEQAFKAADKGTDLPFRIGDLIAQDMAAQAAKEGESFSPDVYLRHQGFQNQESINALKFYSSKKNSGEWEKQFLPLASQEANPEQVTAEVVGAQQKEPELIHRRALLAEESGNLSAGQGPQEYLGDIKRAAFGRRRSKEGGYTGKEESYSKYEDVQKINPWNDFWYQSGANVNLESQEMLKREAERLHIKTGIHQGRYSGDDVYMGDEALYGLSRKIEAAGGDTLAGAGTSVKSAAAGFAASGQQSEAGLVEVGKAMARGFLEEARKGAAAPLPSSPPQMAR